MRALIAILGVWFFTSGAACLPAWAATAVPITLLHTNDLHSHFRPDKTPLQMGGIARLKTAIDRVRKQIPDALLVDGGDWSEGNIYYTEGAGAEILKMMNVMGYDVTVVGNHDWLNGPDTMLDAVEAANPTFSMVGANFDASAYPRQAEWNKYVLPFVVKEVNGVKIAFIGLATYEFIYDKYIAPIKITEPFSLTNELAQKLKQVVDAVVVISHNRISYNQALLKAAPDVDLVIGAHDHVKLTKPVVVSRPGAPDAWIVETGCWGHYLGRVDMKVTPRDGDTPSQVELVSYGLTQMDRTIPEDPTINDKITELEAAITQRMGPVFTDHIAQSNMELDRDGTESTLGNFITDSYRKATGADLALDVKPFVYDSIHTGVVDSVDMYNSNPAIYNPQTGKTWTLKTLPVKGSTLQWIFNLLLFKQLPSVGALYTSGVNVQFDGTPKAAPSLGVEPDVIFNTYSLEIPNLVPGAGSGGDVVGAQDNEGSNPGDLSSTIQKLFIAGQPLDPEQTYLVTGGGGIFEAIATINSMFPNLIPLDGIADTGIESWRASADYIQQISPVTPDKIVMGTRVQSIQPDLGLYDSDVTWKPLRTVGSSVVAQLTVTVHNYGATASPSGASLLIAKNKNGNNLALAEAWQNLISPLPIGVIPAGGSKQFQQTVTLTPDRGVYSVTAAITGNDFEVNHGNDGVTRYFLKK